jgi:hypothetical protein
LCKAILDLKKNESLCERMGQSGRLWAEQNHSLKVVKGVFEELLARAMREMQRTRI